jgi:hydroxymethylpyrimidine pyrophosphatase-like HAD family hydrolase
MNKFINGFKKFINVVNPFYYNYLDDISIKESQQSYIDKKSVEAIINLLKEKPEFFTSKWYNDNNIESTIRSKDKNILIFINYGSILRPREFEMTKSQRETIINLIKPIADKEINELFENYK